MTALALPVPKTGKHWLSAFVARTPNWVQQTRTTSEVRRAGRVGIPLPSLGWPTASALSRNLWLYCRSVDAVEEARHNHSPPIGRRCLFRLHCSCLSSGKEKAFAEPTLKADDIGRTALSDLARALEASGTVSDRGLCLCLNDSWLVERVRGSRLRVAPGRREDFAKTARQLRKSPARYRCPPAGAANPAYIDSTTKQIYLAKSEPGRASDCCPRARREHEPDSRSFEVA